MNKKGKINAILQALKHGDLTGLKKTSLPSWELVYRNESTGALHAPDNTPLTEQDVENKEKALQANHQESKVIIFRYSSS